MRLPLAVSRAWLTGVIAGTVVSPLLAQPLESGRVIAGRVLDPHGVRTADTILTVGWGTERSFESQPVAMARDGSFRTARLAPGTYVLELVRTPHSTTTPATPIGFAIANLGGEHLRDVEITARRDVWLEGRYVMDSADPAPVWPTSIVVSTWLQLPDGRVLAHRSPAFGAPGGRFKLLNPFGPRVLRVGWTTTGRWRFEKVLLDGVDVTDTPVDFSTRGGSRLEVVFTDRPTVSSPGAAGAPRRRAHVEER